MSLGLRCVLLSALATAAALYSSKSAVVQLTEASFKDILKSDEVWLVEFYAPWCGHCKSLVPEWEAAAQTLKGVVKVAALDGTAAESVMRKYDVKGFPSLKIFGADKKAPVDYQGDRKGDAIVAAGMKAANDMVKARKGGSKKGDKKDKKDKKASSGKKPGSDVFELTEDNFQSLVMDSQDQWLVEFFAPWCGHCKNLAPEWEQAATQLKGSVKLGAVDATVHSGLGQKYGVKGYPTIKIFPAGKKGKAKDYNGPREAAGIVDHANRLLEESNVPPPMYELTSDSVFQENCAGRNICVMMFVPHILDSGAAGRKQYLATLEAVAKSLRGKPLTFLWSEGGAQPALEEAMEATFGYPALVVLAKEKGIYGTLRASWSEKNIVSFISGVLGGKETRGKIENVPSIVTVPKWDGKDATLQVDEIPLDEIMG
jgi:protein disulfide-isomerase A6